MRGKLIVVEGIDGAGKSTLIRALSEHTSIILTREPTNGPHGAAVRRAFAEGRRLAPERERELVEADRREHVDQVIAPALANGTDILSDRYYYSTAAYQGRCEAEARSIVHDNEAFAPRPDVVLYLDVPAVFALARIQARRAAPTAPETYEGLLACSTRYEAIWADPSLMRGVTFVRLDARERPETIAAAARPILTGAIARNDASCLA
jgi:dTMP kinase